MALLGGNMDLTGHNVLLRNIYTPSCA